MYIQKCLPHVLFSLPNRSPDRGMVPLYKPVSYYLSPINTPANSFHDAECITRLREKSLRSTHLKHADSENSSPLKPGPASQLLSKLLC